MSSQFITLEGCLAEISVTVIGLGISGVVDLFKNIRNIYYIMLPAVNKQQQLTEHLSLNPQKKVLQPKIRSRKQWKDSYQLTGISTPQVIQNSSFKKMFKLRFNYKDLSTNKRHTHVVYFGEKNDFIFTGNKDLRVRKILKMKNIDNPFHSDYWSAHLANKYSTLKQGLQKFTQFFISSTNKDLEKKQASQLIILK